MLRLLRDVGVFLACTADTLPVLLHFGIDHLDKTNRSLDLFLHLVQFLLVGIIQLNTGHTAFLLLQVDMEGSESCHHSLISHHHTAGMLIVM
tara:strand:- start:639 stop:914 length:276 start_codon:yes stop_codon:yes gene_type:complete